MFAIVINEISPASDPEWVELYSQDNSSLQNCTLYLHGTEDTKQKIIFNDDIKVENYFVVHKGEFNWTSNWLNNSGDTVKLKCPEYEDNYTYSDTGDETIGRNPDGSGSFFVLTSASEGSANSPPTPEPTAKPTPTPKVTLNPSPAVKATTSPTGTPVGTQKPSLSPTFTPKPEVKAATIAYSSSSPSPSAEVSSVEVEQMSSPFSWLLIVAGLILVAAGAFPFVRKLYNEKYASDQEIP